MKIKCYSVFPTYKAMYGIVIDLGENITYRYQWYPDTFISRNHIIDHLKYGTKRIYIGWLRKWVSPALFNQYVNTRDYEFDRKKFYLYCRLA